MRDNKAENQVLKVAFPFYEKSLTNLDPHNIQTSAEAILVQSLYSRLFDLHDNGKINGELAKDLRWENNAYTLTIHEYKTESGTTINAEDVYFSLLRIMAIDESTHGSLKSLLCPNSIITNLHDTCAGLKLIENKIILKPNDLRSKSFIIPLLGSVDFSILPKDQINFENPKKINLNLKNTTGLYFVAQDDPDGKALLEMNKSHFHYSVNHFGKLQLVPSLGKDSINKLKTGEVDYITTIGHIQEDFLKSIESSLSIHKTQPFHLFSFTFTEKAMNKYDQKTRLALGSFLRKVFIESNIVNNRTETYQFFPSGAEGHLDVKQEQNLIELISNSEEVVDLKKHKFKIIVFKAIADQFKKLVVDLPFIEVVPARGAPWLMSEEEQPDLYLGATDSNFFANLALLSYNFSNETFGSKADGKKWIDDFIMTESKEERLEKLRDLHYSFLSSGRVIPAFFTPYIAVSNKPLNIELSTFFAGNPFSLITLKTESE